MTILKHLVPRKGCRSGIRYKQALRKKDREPLKSFKRWIVYASLKHSNVFPKTKRDLHIILNDLQQPSSMERNPERKTLRKGKEMKPYPRQKT